MICSGGRRVPLRHGWNSGTWISLHRCRRLPRRRSCAWFVAWSRKPACAGFVSPAVSRSIALPTARSCASRSPSMQRQLNLKVKFRESFRPFAPSVLREDVAEWFELDCDSPYMLLVADVVEDRRCPVSEKAEALFGIDRLNTIRSQIPAVTHVDMSARIQTVHKETNPRYHALLSAFKARTGCPVLVNTSFNVRSEPIVCTPEDAFRCFMGTDIELLVAGNCVARKGDQDSSLRVDYRGMFEPD